MVLSPGSFPLWPVNRLFANLAGTSGRIERLLRSAQIEPGSEIFGGQIASEDLARLLRQIAWATRDETWSLRSVPTRLGTFKQACEIAVRGRTIEIALRATFRFYHDTVDDLRPRLSIVGDRGEITLADRDPFRPARDVLHMIVLHSLFVLVEWLAGKPWIPDEIVLRHEAPPHAEQLERIFGTAIVGNAPATRLVLPRALLHAPIVAEADQVPEFVASIFQKITRLLPSRSVLAAKTAAFIVTNGNWEIQRKEVAALIGMSAATLNRRLRSETGAGFQAIKDHSRQKAARELMTIEGLTLDEIARLLGFSELSSFHRAFRRWYGEAPGSYRDRLLASSA